jgi:hypothetical protein
MTSEQSFTLIVSCVGIAGALGGIAIGHFLTRSSQHKQWLRDRRLEEYKLVLAAVNETFEAYTIPTISNAPITVSKCFRTISNCVLIADDLEQIDLVQTLLKCQKHYDLTRNVEGFGSDRRILVDALIKMAHKIL